MGRPNPRFFIDRVPPRPRTGDIVRDNGVPVRTSVYTRRPHRRGMWIDMATGEVVATPVAPRVQSDAWLLLQLEQSIVEGVEHGP